MVLSPPESLYRDLLELALREDMQGGDITTMACVPADVIAVGSICTRQQAVVCGGFLVRSICRRIDPEFEVKSYQEEGVKASAGSILWSLRGRACSLLMAERVLLNFVQRLMGIATLTRTYVDALPSGSPTRIADTRKTTPGFRLLERYAVRVGGGYNHRDNLTAGVLIKDNHIAACGGIRQAVERAKRGAPHLCHIACELDRLDQIEEALGAGADVLLLDNMDSVQIAEGIRMVQKRACVEVSGGVTLESVSELARIGVDVISVGALTHSAPAIDVGLDFDFS
ncbi:nicotinate-nucleotide diphosphorylase (carboxylating) [Pajaroellobacter abortibovis]|uniref:Probable nicotinate-nucleotide pyrophosphorylase [carboxylating] n=2 Tax=Pajaroellobacter abortibovis TaxID=1882918 RepID=A0A1L6MZ94_9BACT|nr:nicotinate-nucleotide diphosphorylase (carboxylating) [Pajaroellobacter abortibovis]